MPNSSFYPLLTHCPICHSLYAKEDVKLVEEVLHARLYHSACQSCGHGLLAYVIESAAGVSSLGLVTDTSGVDAVRFAEYEPVSAEECIDAHRLILADSRELCRRLLDISGKLA